jgi:hypothetical protein
VQPTTPLAPDQVNVLLLVKVNGKNLRTCLGSIGLYALPRISAVSRAAKHPQGPAQVNVLLLWCWKQELSVAATDFFGQALIGARIPNPDNPSGFVTAVERKGIRPSIPERMQTVWPQLRAVQDAFNKRIWKTGVVGWGPSAREDLFSEIPTGQELTNGRPKPNQSKARPGALVLQGKNWT